MYIAITLYVATAFIFNSLDALIYITTLLILIRNGSSQFHLMKQTVLCKSHTMIMKITLEKDTKRLKFVYIQVCNIHTYDRSNVADVASYVRMLYVLSVVPKPAILLQSSADIMTVGEPYSIHCIVNTSERINDRIVKIGWTRSDGFIVNDSRITIHSAVSDDGTIHNSTLQLLYISQEDSRPFTCSVTILDIDLSQTFQIDNISSKLCLKF